MKIRVRSACIALLYVFSFMSALAYMRFTLTQVYRWRLIYLFTIFVMIAICVIYIVSKRVLRADRFLLLLGVIVAYELIVSAYNNLFVVPMIFVDVILWPLLLGVFYDYSKEYDMPGGTQQLTVVGMASICLLSIPNIIGQFTHINGGAIFVTYYCFAFLPLVYLYCSKKVAIVFGAIVAVLMLLSLKRAAFIIVVVGISIYYISTNYVENGSKKRIQRMFGMLLALIVLSFIGQFLINRLNLNIIRRLSNILEDGGSGRTRIWGQVLSFFNGSPAIKKIFGHGFHSVFYQIKPLGIARYAHNSLLETLYDYGIVGLSFIIVVVIKLLSQTIIMLRDKSSLAPVMSYTMVPMLLLSVVSYFFEQSVIIIPHVIVWGICLGVYHRKS